jgi:cell division protein FtsI/penicillin-binding protein 2
MLLKRSICRLAAVVCLAVAQTAAAQVNAGALQRAVTRAMAGQRGTAVVLDVHSGSVLASYRLDVAARRLAYPGSSIKPFTLLALLESGKLDGQTALMCKRSLQVAGRKLDCSHPDVKEPLDAASALAYSCNSYFTQVALRLTPGELRDEFVRDGFASVTALAPDEAAGNVAIAPSPSQQQLQAIGEWGVKVTPLELARAYRQLALLAPQHDARLDSLFIGLDDSVAYGMAHAAQPTTAAKVAGKTGTAPADEGQWTHAWFAGYAPAQHPGIVVVVFLEKGHGGSEAATVARSIFEAFPQSKHSEIITTVGQK